MIVKLGSSSPSFRGENKTCLSCHHLEKYMVVSLHVGTPKSSILIKLHHFLQISKVQIPKKNIFKTFPSDSRPDPWILHLFKVRVAKVLSPHRTPYPYQSMGRTVYFPTILPYPIGSMGLVYLPTWMVDFYGFHVGEYAIHGSYGYESSQNVGKYTSPHGWYGCVFVPVDLSTTEKNKLGRKSWDFAENKLTWKPSMTPCFWMKRVLFWRLPGEFAWCGWK